MITRQCRGCFSAPRGSGLSCQSQRRPGGFHILPWGNQGEDSWLLDHQTWGSRWALRGLGSTHWPFGSPGVSNPPRAVISPCPSLLPVVGGGGNASVLPSLGGSFLIPPHKGASDENAAYFPAGECGVLNYTLAVGRGCEEGDAEPGGCLPEPPPGAPGPLTLSRRLLQKAMSGSVSLPENTSRWGSSVLRVSPRIT